jgi:hypothetical protein
MAIKASIIKNTALKAKVTNTDGRLSIATPITLKNQIQEIRSIEDFGDVDEINVTNGASLVYNSTSSRYEIRPFELGDLGNIDLGEF